MNPWKEVILLLAVTLPAWTIAAWMFYTWDIGGIRSDIKRMLKDQRENQPLDRLAKIKKLVSDIEKIRKEQMEKQQLGRLAKIKNEIKEKIEAEKKNVL